MIPIIITQKLEGFFSFRQMEALKTKNNFVNLYFQCFYGLRIIEMRLILETYNSYSDHFLSGQASTFI